MHLGQSLRPALINHSSIDGTAATLETTPFTAAVLPDLVAGQAGYDDELLAQVRAELKDMPWKTKNNDLYFFYQTNGTRRAAGILRMSEAEGNADDMPPHHADLKTCAQPGVAALCRLLQGPLRQWMERATGMALHPTKVDIFAARYPDTGTLLCHDDRLEGRRIAFILYLTPGWQATYGGGLDLFGVDAAGGPGPGAVVRTVVPVYNTLAFFRVSARSYHQVAEVTAPGRERWSVTGWYHALDSPAVDVDVEAAAPPRVPRALPWAALPDPDSDPAPGLGLEDWLSPDYLTCVPYDYAQARAARPDAADK
jgi:hypothetical protein